MQTAIHSSLKQYLSELLNGMPATHNDHKMVVHVVCESKSIIIICEERLAVQFTQVIDMVHRWCLK